MERSPVYRAVYSQTRYVSFDSVVRNRFHRHSYFEPCIVVSGNGEFEHDSTVYPLVAGDLFIADRGVYHEIRSVESKDLRLYFLAFNILGGQGGEQSVPDQACISGFLGGHRTHLSGQGHLVPLFDHVARLVRRDPGYADDQNFHDASRLLLRQVMTLLARSALLTDEAYNDQLRRRRIEEFIESRLHLPIRVPDIAAAYAVSERTLRRLWSKWSSRSLAQELRHRRIERAAQLLTLPDMTIADVGYQVGINSPAQFSRQFREVVGMPPATYRKKVLAGLGPDLSGGQGDMTEYLESPGG